MPNVVGMTAKDVLYLLENNNYMRVKLTGSGAVSSQSLAAGTEFKKGTEIVLELATSSLSPINPQLKGEGGAGEKSAKKGGNLTKKGNG